MEKVNEMVDTVNDIVSKTRDIAAIYQNKAIIPAIEMVSIWAGIKKGASALFRKH